MVATSLYVRTNKEISELDRGLPYTIGNIPMLLRLVWRQYRCRFALNEKEASFEKPTAIKKHYQQGQQ